MIRQLLEPLWLYVAGALFFALVAALIGLWWSISEHADTRAERDALQQRVETLQAVKGLRNEAANDTDDGLADSISDVQQPR